MIDAKKNITLAGIAVFASDGIMSTLQDVAKKAGVKQPHVSYYFKDKHELIKEMVIYIVDCNHQFVDKLIRPEDDAYERLLKHYQGNVDWALKHPDQAQIILLLYYSSVGNQEFNKIYTKLSSTGLLRITEHLMMGAREKLWIDARLAEKSNLIYRYTVGSLIELITSQEEQHQKVKRSLIADYKVLLNTVLKK